MPLFSTASRPLEIPEGLPAADGSPTYGTSLSGYVSEEELLVAAKIIALLDPKARYQNFLEIRTRSGGYVSIRIFYSMLRFKIGRQGCYVLTSIAAAKDSGLEAKASTKSESEYGEARVMIRSLGDLDRLKDFFRSQANETYRNMIQFFKNFPFEKNRHEKELTQALRLNTNSANALLAQKPTTTLRLSTAAPKKQSGTSSSGYAASAAQPASYGAPKKVSSSAPKTSKEKTAVPSAVKASSLIPEAESCTMPPVPEEAAIENIALTMEVEHLPFLMYALQQNNYPLIEKIVLTNSSPSALTGLSITIHAEGGFLEDFEAEVQEMEAGETLILKGLELHSVGESLAQLSDPMDSTFEIRILYHDTVLAAQTCHIRQLPFDQWCGSKMVPYILAAFSIPGHPVVNMLMQSASKILKNWNQDPSMEGYQSDNPDRVRMLAAAAYAAIQQLNITYAMPPRSFGFIGQRIRLADAIMDERMGTCMDMTMLYSSLLEAMGLHPILVLEKGHIYAGVWLKEAVFENPLVDDPSALEKRCAAGINDMLVVECTAMNAGHNVSFEQACGQAAHSLSRHADFQYALDVRRLRAAGVRPMPVRTKAGETYQIEHEDRSEDELTDRPDELAETIDFSTLSDSEEAMSRRSTWQRKLLDLSLRNTLISLRFTSSVIPLLTHSLAQLEDNLFENEEYKIVPRPQEWEGAPDLTFVSPEFFRAIAPLKKLLELESKAKRLPSLLTPSQLDKSMTALYRTAKTNMEETGAGTLFLALGLLRWFAPHEKSARYAPLVLVPVELRRKAGKEGYSLLMRDEESQINITLLEYLKQTFNLKIPGLTPPPKDEHGLDIPKILAIFRHGVMEQESFDVIEAACLANFFFAQFPMWNDIAQNPAFLDQSPIVHALMNGQLDYDCSLPGAFGMEELVLPAPLDSSQKTAVMMAEKGADFVLHGPPGTGKSQTITTMIAHLLGQGKTVLFAAEKMAALEVVQKRLDELGLSRYVLELHSAKATRKAILARMKQALEKTKAQPPEDLERKLEETRALRAQLSGYSGTLHIKRNCGSSLAELISIFLSLDPSLPEVIIDPQQAIAFGASQTDQQLAAADQLEVLLENRPSLAAHPLAAVRGTVYTSQLEDNLETLLKQTSQLLSAVSKQSAALSARYGLPALSTQRDFLQAKELGAFCSQLAAMKPWQLIADSVQRKAFFDTLHQKLEVMKQQKQAREKMTERWHESILHVRVNDLERQYTEAQSKLIGRKKAQGALCELLASHAKFTITPETFLACCREIEELQRMLNENASSSSSSGSFFASDSLCGSDGQNAMLKEALQDLSSLNDPALLDSLLAQSEAFWKEYGNLLSWIHADPSEKVQFKADLQQFASLCGTLDQWMSQVQEWLDPALPLDEPDNPALFERFAQTVLANRSELQEWMLLQSRLASLKELGMESLVDACLQQDLRHNLKNIWLKSLCRTIIRTTIDQDPILRGFAGAGFEKSIEHFASLDEELMKLEARQIELALQKNLPRDLESVKISQQLNILRKACASGGRGISIRSLFLQIPDVLTRLFPCLLMSPVSVSQYLDCHLPKMDLAIFDEASQMPTCNAVGVLARAKHAIICGDPNQMPPSSFFGSVSVDEEHPDLEDLDSILDDALALGLPSLHLEWHYRSRHESLIAFSNREFYENRMLTFPSADYQSKKVLSIPVAGTFERGGARVNRKEARAIVETIALYYQEQRKGNLPAQSIGVVTFNLPQQNLIQDMLMQLGAKIPDFDRWMNEGKEPLFVKNLENVQGDERDIILFSITYGPDLKGTVSMNFGPLNREGGWKRLNVAITRARSQMAVFSSLSYEQIDLRRTSARGVQALRSFLEYAARPVSVEQAPALQDAGSLMAYLLHKKLAENGIASDLNVGMSSQKVDIAIRNPWIEGQYCAGILLDTSSAAVGTDIRDRQIGSVSVLEGLGWHLIRLWTIDWWNNPDKTWNALLEKVQAALQDAPRPESNAVNVFECQKEQELLSSVEERMPDLPDEPADPSASTMKKQAEVNSSNAKDLSAIQKIRESGSAASKISDQKQESQIASFEKTSATASVIASQTNPAKAAGLASSGLSEIPDKSSAAEKTDSAYSAGTVCSADFSAGLAGVQPVKTGYTCFSADLPSLNSAMFTAAENEALIVDTINRILEAEAPISVDLLQKRLLRSFGISRSSAILDAAFAGLLKQSAVTLTVQDKTQIAWHEKQKPEEYALYRHEPNPSLRRSPDQIPLQELKNAVLLAAAIQPASDEESLIRQTAHFMGYSRISSLLHDAIAKTIHLLQTAQ